MRGWVIFICSVILCAATIKIAQTAVPYDNESRLVRVQIAAPELFAGFYDSAVDNMDFRGSLEWSDWGAYVVFRACLTTNQACYEEQAELLFREIVLQGGQTVWIRAFDIRQGVDREFGIGVWEADRQQVYGRLLGPVPDIGVDDIPWPYVLTFEAEK